MPVGWADLQGSRSHKLGRHGKVHPELSSALDSQVQHLAGIAQNISAIFGEYKKEK